MVGALAGRSVARADLRADAMSRAEMTANARPCRDRPNRHGNDASRVADLAVWALIQEAELTPKPALVDLRGPGAHLDLDVGVLRRSAHALRPCFVSLYESACGQRPGRALRESLAAIGREGERAMLDATGGSNAHRGAIWTLGLLVAGCAIVEDCGSVGQIAHIAAMIARYPDLAWSAHRLSNGERARLRYGVPGAHGEARAGFPHVMRMGWPQLRRSLAAGATLVEARLDALLAIMSTLSDTCLLHRGGSRALEAAQRGASLVLAAGGCRTEQGRDLLKALHRTLMTLNASPGGAADLLAAVLFVDRLATAAAGPIK